MKMRRVPESLINKLLSNLYREEGIHSLKYLEQMKISRFMIYVPMGEINENLMKLK